MDVNNIVAHFETHLGKSLVAFAIALDFTKRTRLVLGGGDIPLREFVQVEVCGVDHGCRKD